MLVKGNPDVRTARGVANVHMKLNGVQSLRLLGFNFATKISGNHDVTGFSPTQQLWRWRMQALGWLRWWYRTTKSQRESSSSETEDRHQYKDRLFSNMDLQYGLTTVLFMMVIPNVILVGRHLYMKTVFGSKMWQTIYSTPQELCTQLALCCVVLWFDTGRDHILQGHFSVTGAVIRLVQCQCSDPER